MYACVCVCVCVWGGGGCNGFLEWVREEKYSYFKIIESRNLATLKENIVIDTNYKVFLGIVECS